MKVPSSLIESAISLLLSGHSARQISSILGLSLATISRIRNERCPDLPRSPGGRPCLLTPSDMRLAIRYISSGKADTAVQVHKLLQDATNMTLSVSTLRANLKSAGLKSAPKVKRAFLSPRHRRERLNFAYSHLHWTVDDWKRVVWSDESKINRFGSDGRKWVWKKPGECINDRLVDKRIKHGGGSIMVWGCFGWEGTGILVKIDGKMDADLFCQILEDDLQGSLAHWGKTSEEVIFQQDNDPKHTSKKAKTWLKNHEINTMIWPPQSPDLNPIEHLWSILKRRLAEYETTPNGIHELWERVQEVWEKIEVETCRGLIESMPRRMEEVMKAKGGYTRY